MATSIQNNAWYVFMNVTSRTVADLDNGSSGNGTPIQGWDMSFSSKALNQAWQLQSDKDGSWRIINSSSGTNWDLNDGSKKNGTKIQGWSKADVDAQRWFFKKIDGSDKQIPRWNITNKASGTYVDLDDGSNTNGTRIQGWDGDGKSTNQQWILIPVS